MINFKDLLARLGTKADQDPDKTVSIGPETYPHVDVRDKIGKYEVISEISRGAMGVVLLGYDPYIKRKVAIKIINPTRLEQIDNLDEYKSRFFREAQAAGNLYHPNIVTIYDANEIDALCLIVMEHISGVTLETFCSQEGNLPLERVVTIGIEICHALDYAHQRQIIHRDIKPSNILMSDEQEVKITDFGIAYMPSAQEISEDTIVGTPYYLAPEQIVGEPVSARSDFFSLGIVLYELIAGKRPFEAVGLNNILEKILNDPPPPLSQFREGVPESLEKVIRKALTKDVENRYQDGIAFARDLENSLKDQGAANLEPSLRAKVGQLENLLFFQDFSEREVEAVLRVGSWRMCVRKETIVRQDEKDTSFYILVSGTVSVEIDGKSLAVLHRGDCFGELAFLRRKERIASVIAQQDCQLLKISDRKANVLPPEIQLLVYQSMAKTLAEKLVDMDMRYLSLA